MGVDHRGHSSYFIDQFRRKNTTNSTNNVANEKILANLRELSIVFLIIIKREIGLNDESASKGI
jgi:hypothetical protein